MARRYFSKRDQFKSHYHSHHYENTQEGMFEKKVELFLLGVLRRVLSIPRRILAAFKSKKHFPKV